MEEIQNNIPPVPNPNNGINNLSTSDIQQAKEVVDTLKETVQSTQGKGKLMGIILVLLFVVIGMGSYILIKEGYFKTKAPEITPKEKEIVEPKGEEKESELDIFQGEYISAEAPQGWSIKEYKNGDGSEMVVEGGQYKGLSGFEISKENKNIMKLQMLDGVGSVGCPQIVLFKDTPKNFEEIQKTNNTAMGLDAKVLDYKDTPYSQTTLFNTILRRVGTGLFYDNDSDTEGFEAQCENNWIELKELEKVSNGLYYSATISQEATKDELTILDSVLESMKLVK